jgi:DNA-binding NtrC family response regulator
MVMQVVRFGNHAVATIPSDPSIYNTSVDGASELSAQSLIGVSRWTQNARMLVSVHAAHNSPVILEGEPGTGKRLLARLIHRLSSRREGPFVSLGPGSIGDEVARAALFGSVSDKGIAELAAGGTLYLEGFADLSPSLADDIIRFAERRCFDREEGMSVRVLLGRVVHTGYGQSTETSNAASTALDYDRIQIPALRDRPDDIEALTVHFIRERCEQTGKEPRKISPEAMKVLRDYDWPRNVIELRTLVHQIVKQLSPPSIEVSLLPAYLAGPYLAKCFLPPSGLDLDNEVKRVEVELICAALRQCRGLQNKAAQLLHIKPTTLFMKIRRHGIDVGAFR